jgi:tetratricopeptide (TPR) repeat protein
VLLNFDELSKIDQHHFASRLKPWSEDRLLLSELNNGEVYNINLDQEVLRSSPLTNLYNLDGYIYLDRNAYEDTVVYLTRTMIDLKTSYYHLKPNKNTTCILNMYFDFIEMERRSLEEILLAQYWTEAQVDSIYAKMHQQMQYNLGYFWSAVEHGEMDEEVLRYAKIIKNHLGIDNTLLIWSDYMTDSFLEIKSTSEPWVQMYNYGTLCLKQGKYDQALQSLESAYEMGSRDPWLLYNLGLTYIKLNEIVKGCQFLRLSQELGEEVPDELISVCK